MASFPFAEYFGEINTPARVRALLRKTFAPSCDVDASNPS
jgi:hypothetical protein